MMAVKKSKAGMVYINLPSLKFAKSAPTGVFNRALVWRCNVYFVFHIVSCLEKPCYNADKEKRKRSTTLKYIKSIFGRSYLK